VSFVRRRIRIAIAILMTSTKMEKVSKSRISIWFVVKIGKQVDGFLRARRWL
jgi:hypothetical protein